MKIVVPYCITSSSDEQLILEIDKEIRHLGYQPYRVVSHTPNFNQYESFIPFFLLDPCIEKDELQWVEIVKSSRFPHAIPLKIKSSHVPLFLQLKRSSLLPIQPIIEGDLPYNLVSELVKTIGDSNFNFHQFSEKIGYSMSSYERHCKKYFGINPGEMLREIRLKLAYDLIRTTTIKTADIAWLVGYHSHPTFSREFKAKYEITPTQLRLNQESLFLCQFFSGTELDDFR